MCFAPAVVITPGAVFVIGRLQATAHVFDFFKALFCFQRRVCMLNYLRNTK